MLNFFKKTDNLLAVIATFLILIVLIGYSQVCREDKTLKSTIEDTYFLHSTRIKEDVLDTLYTDKNCIVEVRLDLQKIFLHKKNSGIDTFLCSTGTAVIKDGIVTNTGIFTVQNKLPVLISKQFNDTKCLNWIGFNYGIGFHALENRGYYWSLGKRASSHGCVRVSQEDAKKLFNEVTIGTPIVVHNSKNARVVSFLPENLAGDTNYTKKEIKQILRNKLSLLYQKKYFYQKNIAFVLSNKFINHDGVDIGDRTKVPMGQHIPIQPNGFPIRTCIQDHSSVLSYYIIPDSLLLESESISSDIDSVKTDIANEKDVKASSANKGSISTN
jgi:hypothetical protein